MATASNTNEVSFGVQTTGWSASHYELRDGSTVLAHGALDTPIQSVGGGRAVAYDAGEWVFTHASGEFTDAGMKAILDEFYLSNSLTITLHTASSGGTGANQVSTSGTGYSSASVSAWTTAE